MENLKMNNNTLVITGSDGSTAQGLINFFSDKYINVIGFSRSQKVSYNSNNIDIMCVDMLNFNQVNDAVSNIVNKYGMINGWINCVGGFSMGDFIENEEEWDEMYSINFITCLNGCRAIIPQLKKQNNGCIINFGSKAALGGFPTAAPYLISKSSVHALTKLISIEMGESNARCNAILPRTIDTPSNRSAMPNEDYNTWESIDDIALQIHDTLLNTVSGKLITLQMK